MEQNNNDYLKKYINLVEFIGSFLPPNCEIVLHDINNIDRSIVAMKNNYISGREIGAPITDFGLMLLKDKVYEKKDYILNYSSKTKNGKILRSSTYFIKDDDNKLIALLCVNIDLSETKTIEHFFDRFLSVYLNNKSVNLNSDTDNEIMEDNNTKNDVDIIEHFENSVDDIVGNVVKQNLAKLNIPPERLSAEERIEIVDKLNENGIFLIKGAVAEAAKQLKVSENTIYRYINKLNS
jgi:predicted transcriptional regulator YheO